MRDWIWAWRMYRFLKLSCKVGIHFPEPTWSDGCFCTEGKAVRQSMGFRQEISFDWPTEDQL